MSSPSRKNVLLKDYRTMALFMLVVLLIVSGAAWIIQMFQEKQKPLILMGLAFQNLQRSTSLNITIQETGNEYFLEFDGRLLKGNTLLGHLPEYGLSVIRRNTGEVFVQDKKDQTWKNSSMLGLDNLDQFLLPPGYYFCALETLLGQTRLIEDKHHNHSKENNSSVSKKVAIYIPFEELKQTGLVNHLPELFKQKDESFSLDFLLTLSDEPATDDSVIIRRMKIIAIDDATQEVIIERVYYLEPTFSKEYSEKEGLTNCQTFTWEAGF